MRYVTLPQRYLPSAILFNDGISLGEDAPVQVNAVPGSLEQQDINES